MLSYGEKRVEWVRIGFSKSNLLGVLKVPSRNIR
jgi:hypothetical protein